MPNPIYATMPTTIFTVMSGLARELGAINLGQGFPDEPGPRSIRERAAAEVLDGYNQYPPMPGIPELREAVAKHYALFQVVVFAPAYDAYLPMIRRAGGVPRIVRLTPPSWRFTRADLEAAFTARTRLVVLNNPLNPTASVCPPEDLALLAEFCVRFDAVAVCDEVWEQVVFDGLAHTPLIGLPGMRERTVKIGSAGKLFALTGWKVGWLCAAPALTNVLAKAHQFLTFTTPPNLQAAVAWGLGNSDDWFAAMPADLTRSRDRLADALRAEGFTVLQSQGAYFLNVDLAASGISEGDVDFCLRAVKEAGVAAIPLSVFYETDPVTHIIRLCFAKRDETLDEGARRLAMARQMARA